MSVSNPFSVSVNSPAATAPSWVSGLSLNTWTTLSNANNMQDVFAPNIGQYATNGPAYVLYAWNSAALHTSLGTHGSFIHWGGGHQDYYGNEVYRFDLSTLTWSRLNETSASPFSSSSWPAGLRNDGKPAACHTYQYIDCRTATGEYYTMRRETTNGGGGGYFSMSRFNTSTLTWTNSAVQNPISSISYDNQHQCYDSSRDCVWMGRTNGPYTWARYNPSSDTWDGPYTLSGNYAEASVMFYSPTKDCVAFFPDSAGTMLGLDPASPTTAPVTLTQSATKLTVQNVDSKPRWSSTQGKFYMLEGGTSNVWSLTPPSGDWRTGTWTWAQVSTTGAASHFNTLTYSKFQICEWGSYVVGVLNARHNASAQAVRLA